LDHLHFGYITKSTQQEKGFDVFEYAFH
jgi:hypothetical protein